MSGAAENDDQPSVRALFIRNFVYFPHKRAGCIKDFALFCLKQRVYIPWYTVRPNEHAGTVRNVLKRMRGVHTELLQTLNFVHVVNDFTIGINFSVFFRLLLGEVHCTAYAEAESGGFGYRYAHTCSFSS